MKKEMLNDINVEAQNPWLSIVIPIYNAQKYLSRCLESIIEQTYRNFEVLLIDDGSNDNSANICQDYSLNDKRIRYIKKENGGSYQTRIYGAERALGTYITFCDADDYYCNKDVFECIHKEIVESNCSALQFGYILKYNHMKRKEILTDTTKDINREQFLANEYPKLLCSFWDDSHLTTTVWNKVYHRSLVSNLPSSETAKKLFWGDDQVMNLYMLSTCESLRLIPDILYCYRQFSGNTSNFSLHTMKDLDNIKKYQLSFLENYQSDSKDRIENVLFSEVAGWFYIYIQQALEQLSEEEVFNMINETLQYTSFKLARDYYLNKPEEDSENIDLIRKADANEYIKRAKECHKNKTIKDKAFDLLKHIYASI